VFTRVDIGTPGEKYVADRLKGGGTLSRFVLRSVRLEEGRVTAWVPPGHVVSSESITEALHPPQNREGIEYVPSAEGEGEALHFVRTYLSSNPGSALWVEDPMARRSDPWWDNDADARARAFFFGEEPYWEADGSTDETRLMDVIRIINPFPGWGGGGYLTTTGALGDRADHDLDEATLSSIAEGGRAHCLRSFRCRELRRLASGCGGDLTAPV
jgi:hypothetical protein